MNTLSYKTKSVNKESADREWVIIDATDMIVGRLASATAMILRGKHKPTFTPHSECGDFVIIVNAEKVRFTGNKWEEKEYMRHTGFPGGQRTLLAKELLKKKPEAILEKAIRGMLPKNRLGRQLFRNLNVYVGSEHPHEAQKPSVMNINTIK